jgi:hypothetical protein
MQQGTDIIFMKWIRETYKILLQLLCAYQQLKWLVNVIQMFNILKLHLTCYTLSNYAS